MALSTARMRRVRGRPPLLAAGIISLIHSHSSSVRSLGYIFSFIYPFYTTHEDFSDRLLDTFLKQTKEARVFRRAQAVRDVVKGHRLQTVSDTLARSEEHTSELQSRLHLVCRLLLEKKK